MDNDCWFRHPKSDQISRDVLPKTLKEFKCGICGKKFSRKKDFMEHRKAEHYHYVSECTEKQNDSCRFSSSDCWYKHKNMLSTDKNLGVERIKNSDLIKRLFDMMEAFADRMALLEEKI